MQEAMPFFGAWPDSGRTELDTQRNPLYLLVPPSSGWCSFNTRSGEKQMVKSIEPAADTADPFIGRVHPPSAHRFQTCGIYNNICAEEGRPFGLDRDNDDAFGGIIFKRATTPDAYKLEDTIDILGTNRPARTPQEPVILRVWYRELQKVLGYPGWESTRGYHAGSPPLVTFSAVERSANSAYARTHFLNELINGQSPRFRMAVRGLEARRRRIQVELSIDEAEFEEERQKWSGTGPNPNGRNQRRKSSSPLFR
ncbi:hypothetical protein C8R43DRAFT_1198894 [Mycena crocata]|nr:hypothetical protein C8R43DRAFT_1198894 [Mycena crocata]